MSRELTKHNDNNTEPVVRMVPIKLVDGKVIQRQPEESVEIKAEFTNFSHQEFDGDNNDPAASQVIPRLDEKNENELSNSNNKEERVVVVPIKLMETGETIMPTFSKLEDPQPPDWSTFSKLNKAKEKEVPLKTPSSPLQPPSPAAEDTAGGQERCRSSRRSSKQTVRFDLNNEDSSARIQRYSSPRGFKRRTF